MHAPIHTFLHSSLVEALHMKLLNLPMLSCHGAVQNKKGRVRQIVINLEFNDPNWTDVADVWEEKGQTSSTTVPH